MVEIFLARAKHLSDARNLLQDDPAAYTSAVALLSVHAAIAFNDALLLKLGARSLRNEDHMASVRETARRCKVKGIDDNGVNQLKRLIAAKSAVSYGDKLVPIEQAFVLFIASQRFETWVYKQFEELA